MFWDKCVNVEFYKHICQKSNFIYLNGKNVVYPQVSEIVWSYIKKDKKNFKEMKKRLIENKKNISIRLCYLLPGHLYDG